MAGFWPTVRWVSSLTELRPSRNGGTLRPCGTRRRPARDPCALFARKPGCASSSQLGRHSFSDGGLPKVEPAKGG